MRRLLLGMVLMAAACGPTQAQAPSPPSTGGTTASSSRIFNALPTPSTSPSLLFAVLEAKGTTNPNQWNTVAIAGLDGYARAKATFAPMPRPDLGCASAELPSPAQVAAGKVYFADGKGEVRSLSVDGKIATVTAFPLVSGQQMLSFAVSPDGGRLLGGVLNLPAKPQLGCSGTPAATGYSLDVYSAEAGKPSVLLYSDLLPANPGPGATDPGVRVMAFAGWDQVGPIATYPTGWVLGCCRLPQNYNGTPVRVDAKTGRVLKEVSPPDCNLLHIASSGNFLCAVEPERNVVSVRRPDGSEIWKAAGEWTLLVSYLSPDDLRLAAPLAHAVGDVVEVVGRDGSRVSLAGDFWPRGWLDAGTVIGNGNGQNLSYVSLSAPMVKVDLGFDAQFVATVRV